MVKDVINLTFSNNVFSSASCIIVYVQTSTSQVSLRLTLKWDVCTKVSSSRRGYTAVFVKSSIRIYLQRYMLNINFDITLVSFVNSMYYWVVTIWTCPGVSNFNLGISKYFCHETLTRESKCEYKIPTYAPCWRYTHEKKESPWSGMSTGQKSPPPHQQLGFMCSCYNPETCWVFLVIYLTNWGDKLWELQLVPNSSYRSRLKVNSF